MSVLGHQSFVGSVWRSVARDCSTSHRRSKSGDAGNRGHIGGSKGGEGPSLSRAAPDYAFHVSISEPAPTEYRVTANAGPDGAAAVSAGAVPLTIDTRWGTGSLGEPGPAELLAAAFAACLLKNLARCRDLLEFRYVEAHVEVIARRQDRPPRFVDISYTVRVATDETERRVELAHQNLRKFGTVYNTLAAVCDVHGSMEASSPSEASGC